MKVGDHSPQISAEIPVGNTEPVADKTKVAAKQVEQIVQQSAREAGNEKKSEMQITGKLVAAELLATPEPKTAAAEKVESAMEETRAKGGGQRDVVVAGAKADEGDVDVGKNGMQGKDRMREIYKSSGINIGNPKYNANGQPLLNGKDPHHWCGVWAADIWKRSGVEVKWVNNQGISTPDGKPLPYTGISSRNDKHLQNVKPGDIVVTNSYEKDTPQKLKKNSPQHHAVVTDVVYEVPGNPPTKVTHPPDAVPEGGKVIGFHTMNGNAAGQPKPDGTNPAIRPGYIDLTKPDYTQGKDGKMYETRISLYYPMPEKKTTSP